MLELTDLCFCYGAETGSTGGALAHISLTVAPGQCVLLCGPSGSGKSTVLKAVNGLVPELSPGILSGRVEIDGMDLSNLPLYKRSQLVASVFQNPKSQFFNTDVESEIVYALENQGMSLDKIEARLERVIAELNLEAFRGKSMFALSGGQKQLVAFASACVTDAPVAVLDEPSANLDVRASGHIAEAIAQMKSRGKAVLIAEHRIGYLRGLVNEAYVMDGGRVFEHFTGDELFSLADERRRLLGLRSVEPEQDFMASLQGAGGSHLMREGEDSLPVSSEVASKGDRLKAERIVRTVRLSRERPPQARSSRDSATACRAVMGQPFTAKPFARLSVRGLAIAHKGRVVAQDISFDLAAGDIAALVGENGVGKTTLLRALAGLFKPKAGTISVDGEALSEKRRRKQFGMVMQDTNHQLFSDSVLGECLLGNPHVSTDEAKSLVASVGLSGLEDRHPASLSGGQKQRLALAVACASGKRLFLLDEPTSGLDLHSMMAVRDVLANLAASGIPVIVATHDREFMDAVCTRALVLSA